MLIVGDGLTLIIILSQSELKLQPLSQRAKYVVVCVGKGNVKTVSIRLFLKLIRAGGMLSLKLTNKLTEQFSARETCVRHRAQSLCPPRYRLRRRDSWQEGMGRSFVQDRGRDDRDYLSFC